MSCDHKFVDSKHCLKCGWVPPSRQPAAPEWALSVYAPWAYAILFLGKTIENRTWKPQPYRLGQRFWLHCSKGNGPTHLAREFYAMRDAAQEAGAPVPPDFVLKACEGLVGHVVGSARLVRVDPLTSPEAREPWSSGSPFMWRLDNPQRLAAPVPASGHQMFWRVPPAVLEQLKGVA